MTIKLEQKHLVKGTRTFELVDDAVNVHIDMPFLNKEFTVVLSILDPEPVINGANLAFVSVVNREPLLELFIDKPDQKTFNDFVQQIKDGVIAEDYCKPKTESADRKVDIEQLQMTLDMLRSYLVEDDIKPLLDSMEALKSEPDSDDKFNAMFKAFDALGPGQGAVLTYAPYIVSLLSDASPD